MRKNKLLLLLALLMTAATGAWATDGIACSASDIGKVLCTDGSIYATVGDATTAQKTAAAMIAYIDATNNKGLAIALADESGTKDYEAAGTACSGKAAVTGGTWRLPSDKDWQYMFIGCGSSESYSPPTFAMSKSYSGLASKLTTAQGAALQTVEYWSSTKDDPNGAWIVVFNGSNATFYMEDKTVGHRVRACLAFDVTSTYTVSLKDGVKDADKWTVKVGEGQAQALPIGGLKGDGTETVTLQYNGRLKVKGVKATSDAAPAKTPATVTTAPTATTGDIAAGSETALVSGGAATGGTMMYKVTTANTKPTSTEGFSADVPTAKTLAAGTYYVWYYVKADASHTDSEISATGIEVTIEAPAAAEGHALSASVVGEIVGSDGMTYAAADKDNLPEGVTAVAMVAYKSETTGSSLAIALADEGSMQWGAAKSTCEGKSAIGGHSWKLPSQTEWKQMFSANGGNENGYTGLNTALATAGGDSSKLQVNGKYWSSTWDDGDFVYRVLLEGASASWKSVDFEYEHRVRAVLGF